MNMAEGGLQPKSFKDSFSKGCGDADEVFCGPCTHGKKWIAVQGYCQVCNEYLCDNCLSVHRNLRLTRGHTILVKDQMPLEQENLFEQPCVEVCKTHHPEIIRYYCNDHDETGCVDCMTLKHKLCKTDRVQDISKGFQATKEFKMIQENLDKFHKEVKLTKAALDNNLKDLEATYSKIQHQVISFRKKVNDYLDKVQREITDEAVKLKEKHQSEIKALIAENESKNSELEGVLQRIQNDPNANVNSLFVIAKQAKLRLGTMKREADDMKNEQVKQRKYVFHPSADIENLVSDKTPLGKLCKEISINTKASYRGNISVKSHTDRNDCWIRDSTLLGPDRMVVTDKKNKNIKLIDLSQNAVVASYKMMEDPRRITTIRSDQVAVLLSKQKKIEILGVTFTITKHDEIPVNKRYNGISYKHGKFAVYYKYEAAVDILDIQGSILHTLQPRQVNPFIQDSLCSIAFGRKDNDSVIVSDIVTNKVCEVTFKGETLHTYTHGKLSNPRGIAMTPDGVLFVCSRSNSCVHIVLPDFTTSNIIIKDDMNIRNPLSITYCDTNHRLYINNKGDTTLHVYDLNE